MPNYLLVRKKSTNGVSFIMWKKLQCVLYLNNNFYIKRTVSPRGVLFFLPNHHDSSIAGNRNQNNMFMTNVIKRCMAIRESLS